MLNHTTNIWDDACESCGLKQALWIYAPSCPARIAVLIQQQEAQIPRLIGGTLALTFIKNNHVSEEDITLATEKIIGALESFKG